MLEQALEMDLDLSQLHGSAKAPREEQSGDNPYLRLFHVVRDDILGHYFGMKIYCNIFYSVEKENKFLIGPKQFFFSICQEEENYIFSFQNIVISSPNNVPKYPPGQHEKDFTQ